MAREDFSPYHEEWAQYGTCRSIGVESFFPDPGREWTAARKVCKECPVRVDCEDYVMRVEFGLNEKVRWGIWAGRSPLERQRYEPIWLKITTDEAREDVA